MRLLLLLIFTPFALVATHNHPDLHDKKASKQRVAEIVLWPATTTESKFYQQHRWPKIKKSLKKHHLKILYGITAGSLLFAVSTKLNCRFRHLPKSQHI
jgi:hypothetical protein